jgi:hypothetical protein
MGGTCSTHDKTNPYKTFVTTSLEQTTSYKPLGILGGR